MPTRTIPTSLTVGDVAKRSGVAVSTVHFYEGKGLIAGWRTTGNQRRYDRTVLRRIAIIQVAQRAGLSLKTIADFLPLDAALGADQWQRIASDWQAMIDQRVELLQRLRDELGGCIGCGCLSKKICPLRNPDDALAATGTGPRILMRDMP
ncbi:MAG: redox-sensitive transcriptional activator SoxR [Sphingomonas paucimobilis]